MKIVATSDTHYVPTMPIPDGDVFIHAGDLMTSGYPKEWEERVEWLAQLPHKVKIYVPGNHDFHMMVYPGPALQDMWRAGVTVVGLPGNTHYASYELPNGMKLLGLPFVTDLPRWAFNATEEEIKNYLDTVWGGSKKYDIVVSHSPVRSILDFADNKQRCVGIVSYLDIFHKKAAMGVQPSVWINGHIHERYGSQEYCGCTFYDVAMCDRKYEHANPPVEIEV